MALPLCPVGVHCPGSDYPVSNFSSEADDGANFIGLSWPGGNNGTSGGYAGEPPPLGSTWTVNGCFGEALAATQDLATDLAIQMSQTCVFPPIQYEQTQDGQWSASGCFGICFAATFEEVQVLATELEGFCPLPPDYQPPTINGDPIPLYPNHEQTCLRTCANGLTVSYTVTAGLVVSHSQEQADSIAYSLACSRVRSVACPPLPPPPPVGPCVPPTEILSDATASTPYSQQLSFLPGDTFTTDPVLMPDWLAVSPTGLATGTPDSGDAGITFLFDVLITNSSGDKCVRRESVFVKSSVCECCLWGDIRTDIVDLGLCAPSANPEWNGFFDRQTLWNAGTWPMFYFTDQSINGLVAAASDNALYPAGNWQDTLAFTCLVWNGGLNQWVLLIGCANGTVLWAGNGPNTILDASGNYPYFFGSSSDIAMIVVSKCASGYCVARGIDWTETVWTGSIIEGPPFATADFLPTPSGSASDSFKVHATGNFSIRAKAIVTGVINYTGPISNFKIAGNIVNNGAPGIQYRGHLKITVQVGMSSTITTIITDNPFPLPGQLPFVTGPYDYHSALPDVCDDTATITIEALVDFDSVVSGDPYDLSIDGTISPE